VAGLRPLTSNPDLVGLVVVFESKSHAGEHRAGSGCDGRISQADTGHIEVGETVTEGSTGGGPRVFARYEQRHVLALLYVLGSEWSDLPIEIHPAGLKWVRAIVKGRDPHADRRRREYDRPGWNAIAQ
jgi:hypothetical protein